MVNLFNLKEKLANLFVLKSEKEEVWSNYLDTGSNYMNGVVYVQKDMIVYHKQSLKNISFNVLDASYTQYNVYVNTDMLTQGQVDNTTFTLDGEVVNFTKSLINTNGNLGFKFKIRRGERGSFRIIVPSYKVGNDVFEGFQVNRVLRSQRIDVDDDTGWSVTDNVLTVNCDLVYPSPNQILKITTLYGNNKTHNSNQIILNGEDSNVTISIICDDNDVKFKLELVSYYNTVDGKDYLGYMLTKNI